MDHKIDQLAESLIVELVGAMALPQTKNIRTLVRSIFGSAARRLSEIALRLDGEIEQNGPAAGARWLLPRFVARHEACGVEIIPQHGPLVIASNHPAAYDGFVISAYIDRPDYKVITHEFPSYYRYLPHVSQHAIFVPPVKNTFGRMQTVRNAIQHLRNGGVLLIFPRGGIEPDPDFMPDPDQEFNQWSRSLEIFLQRVPQTRVLVTMVSGLISQAAMRHPITRLRRARQDRQRLAFMYQMIRQLHSGKELFGLTPRVTFGEVLSSTDQGHFLAEIERSARRTLQQHISAPPTQDHA